MMCASIGYTSSESDCLCHQVSEFDHFFGKPVSLEEVTELFKTARPVLGTS
jgi:hypothetical protein